MLTQPEPLFKRCIRCGLVKPSAAFNLSRELGRQPYCRECQKAWYREHREQHLANVDRNATRYRTRNSEFIRAYLLAHPCVDCGESDPEVLDFDHQRDKLAILSRLAWSSVSLSVLEAEIAKCEVRCANCHFRRTARQLGWRKAQEEWLADVLEMRG